MIANTENLTRGGSPSGSPSCSALTHDSCGYSGDTNTYEPSFSMLADVRCPQCGSTNNQHNADHASQIRKAWSCKHVGTLSPAGETVRGQPLLECPECGSRGLDWAMRGEPMPSSPNVEVHTPAAGGAPPTQVEGGSGPGKSDWERAAGCGATPCSPCCFFAVRSSLALRLVARGLSHLSNSPPQFSQVHPPHQNCRAFLGMRTLGSCFPHSGHVTSEKFIPHRLPFRKLARPMKRIENTRRVNSPPAIPPAMPG